MSANGWSPVKFHGISGVSPVVLICEHASAHFPEDFGTLGISEEAQSSHVAWDIGALDVAVSLSEILDAPLVYGGVSRLLYDCNRPFDKPDCIPTMSERFQIPGNQSLDEVSRNARYRLIHQPFHFAVDEIIRVQQAKAGREITVITIHSFTPIYMGHPRAVEIGFLYHKNDKFSQIAQQIECARGSYRSAINEPYNSADGVTYSQNMHADQNHLHSTMIEIRNDLIDTKSKARLIAAHLGETLQQTLSSTTMQENLAG